ncbi:MAG: nickel transporter [Burkholderiales bacterium]|nr:nickel transporter [Burkholderiales bacterium]
MHELPAEWSALCAVVFLLGMRHGFDPDHLAAIDGMTRLATRRRRPFARYCGSLFSLGHGAVVLAIALAVGLASREWAPPAWIDAFGAWVSIAFLVTIGLVNLQAVLRSEPGTVVALVGVKGRLLGRVLGADSALGVAAVGALFAISFDTLSQGALFALAAARFSGPVDALALGLLFLLGMVVTDGLNGWWISRLIARADQIAALASRVMALAVSAASLLVAALGIARLAAPGFDHWADGKELGAGLAVIGLVAAAFWAAARIRRAAAAAR